MLFWPFDKVAAMRLELQQREDAGLAALMKARAPEYLRATILLAGLTGMIYYMLLWLAIVWAIERMA